jgi:hypothetical protein
MKKVIVTWIDAVSEDSWTDIEEAKKIHPPTMKTLGYLLHQDEHRIVVAASYDEENHSVASIYSIPLTWVLNTITISE